MIRTYGKAPYNVAVIHGGPGAQGSMQEVARELSKVTGVVEPIQSRLDVAGLIEELRSQLARGCVKPVTLIGHAWGAWLSLLYAAEYPEDVLQVVVIGCAPLNALYAAQIMDTRRRRMTQGEWVLFNGLLFRLDRVAPDSRNWLMAQLGGLLDKTDHYDLLKPETNRQENIPVDGDMYLAVWPEAEAMCENGELMRRIRKIQCPLFVIHGQHDPRPVEGVTVPLHANNIRFKRYLLPQCGHVPFRERHAVKPFYGILQKIVKGEAWNEKMTKK